MSTTPAARRVTVDGEVFDVRRRDDGSACDFDWVTGPNPGYGFTAGVPIVFAPVGQTASTDATTVDGALVNAIRHFLQQIDPDTGYIAD